jgi:hypothetical protein
LLLRDRYRYQFITHESAPVRTPRVESAARHLQLRGKRSCLNFNFNFVGWGSFSSFPLCGILASDRADRVVFDEKWVFPPPRSRPSVPP